MCDLDAVVMKIDADLAHILSAFSPEPTAEVLLSNLSALVKLEKAINRKALIDAAIARAAELADAGRLIGANSHIDFLVEKFDISRAEAFRRVNLANQLFGVPFSQKHEESSIPQPDGVEDEVTQPAETEEEKPQEVAAESLNLADELAISAEKLVAINQELSNLNQNAAPHREELFKLALVEARERSLEDVRMWVRKLVNKTNLKNDDPFAAMRKRYLVISQPNADGSVRIHGSLNSATAALLKAALAPLAKRGSLIEGPADEDSRTQGQRNVDGLHHIVSLFHSDALSSRRGGIGSIVVSLCADDIANLEENGAGHRYPTNTGYALTPFEILNLGAAQYDFGVVLDNESGRPLYLGRTQRSASLEQRIALQAAELVCSAPGCSRAMVDCEIHHLDPWIRGGLTNIDNLTPQCFVDHPRNDDSRTGVNNKGYMARDPESGRVARYPADRSGPVFNNSAAQAESGGARTRAKHKRRGNSPPTKIRHSHVQEVDLFSFST